MMIKKRTFIITGLIVAFLCFVLAFGVSYRSKTVKADDPAVEMAGASVRLDEDVDSTGIRFHSRILKSEYTTLSGTYGALTVTTRIVPTAMLEGETLDENTVDADILDVNMTGKQFEIKIDDTDYYEYRTYIYNIPSANYGDEFSAFTYVKAGETVVLKAEAEIERSIAGVAKIAYDELYAADGGDYTQVGDKYSKYTKAQRSILAEYFTREQVYGTGVTLNLTNATDNIDAYPVTEGVNAGKYMATITKSQSAGTFNTVALNVSSARGLAANADYSVSIDVYSDLSGFPYPIYHQQESTNGIRWTANSTLGSGYYTYTFDMTTDENGELSKSFTGIYMPGSKVIHYVKFVDVRLEWKFNVASASIKVLSGTEITLNPVTLGVSNLPDDGTMTFTVTKGLGAGTTKTALSVSAVGDTFTVESGYFYDIDITATVGGNTYNGYVQVADKDLLVYGFENDGETFKAYNFVSTKETNSGNSRIKWYRTTAAAGATPYFNIDDLLNAAGLPNTSADNVTYSVYIDATYNRTAKAANDYNTYWGLQFGNNRGWVAKQTGRYYVGDFTYTGGTYGNFQYKANFFCNANSGAHPISDMDYALDGTHNWLYFDNIVLVPKYSAAPSYTDKNFAATSYGAPGTDADDTPTQAKINTYAAAGFNEYLLLGQNSSLSSWAYSGSQAETTVGYAQTAGISDFIIREKTLADLANYIDLSDKTDAWLYNQVNTYLDRFINLKNDSGNYLIKGVDIGDEPQGYRIEDYAKIYKIVKQIAKEVYNRPDFEIFVCLLPAYGGLAELTLDGSSSGSRYDVYRTYVQTFLSKTGAKHVCVDVYPFQGKGNPRLIEGYYATLQIVAEECVKAGVEYAFVMQAYAADSVYRPCSTAANDTALQFNSTIGFGSKNLIFYRYRSSDADWNDAFFVQTDGSTTTDVYTAAQTQIGYAQNLADYVLNFEYRASAVYASTKSNYTEGVSNDTFKKASVSATGTATVVTELYDDSHGLYMYMLQNALDTVYGSENSTITATFAGYSKVAVISNGVCTVQTLTSNTYSVTLANGEAVYVIPLS